MCACEKPNINGTPGYKWQPDDKPGTRDPNPPAIPDGFVLFYDEPGRCGRWNDAGVDHHCHHFRLVYGHGQLLLLVKHGGGERQLRLPSYFWPTSAMVAMSSHDRFWLFSAFWSAHEESMREVLRAESEKWGTAILDRRIRTNRRKGRVEILPKAIV